MLKRKQRDIDLMSFCMNFGKIPTSKLPTIVGSVQ